MYLWMFRAVSSAYVVGVEASVEEKAGSSGYFSIFLKTQSSLLVFFMAQPNGVSLLAAAVHKEEFPAWGMKTFPRKFPLPVIPCTNANQTPFSASNNSNLVLQSCFVPCCAVVASPFLQKCTQGVTEKLHNRSHLWPGGQRLPQACRWGSVRCQLPWLLGRFNQAGMKASFTEFIAS